MIEYVSIAKAVNQIENKDDIPYFIHSAFISIKGMTKEFHEFYDSVLDAREKLAFEDQLISDNKEDTRK